ncbi:SDR family NAD(P)-dependent oxidoreductase [Sporosarcina pasteurii]|uniref:2-dehydro-3-deoxy-D-gluconate 5-dehydrogenase n=1 Tax=Sporosarcina pasteurii TaxID=1474 RepID=A0A380BE02_SPOPA|nr:glucose 1-dehydrogenase [Sporosarcina pasteurii]MDS9472581.1 glucose 1-dehydrogenase [Sporosarcina pasteurii]QBQ06133.1 glucose 1-dehydrogenase [Sporosarcina pasteurii]SUI99363.1 2-dehydro-3-deoxy-D-gluconate 5-dehydrogenase [Sporosarcina pasteurii]
MDYQKLFSLEGKTALITGGARGLGKAMAEALAQAGANIVIVDMEAASAEKAAKELASFGTKTLGLEVDVTNELQVHKAIDRVVSDFNELNIVINNAGICQKISIEDQSLEDWKKTMDVNVNGVFLISKYAGKQMKVQGGGSIINIASMSSFIANTEAQCAYNASKAAVAMMTKCMASEWVNDNIRVNAIAPGYMKTDMTKPIFAPGGELAHVLDMVPMKRLGEPHELGGLAIYLASEASSFVTGSSFVVDGGYTIW